MDAEKLVDPIVYEKIIHLAKAGMKAMPGTIGGAITGGLTGYYSGRFADAARRKDRLKEEHLADLKRDLLGVLAGRAGQFYIPICDGRVGVLERRTREIQKQPKSVGEDRYVRTEFTLAVKELRDETRDPFSRGASPELFSRNFDRLYDHCHRHHYEATVKDWEELVESFASAAQKHLEYAEQMRTRLKDALKLPAQTASHSDHKTWANYVGLALFIYEHQFGINPWHLAVMSHLPQSVVSSGPQERLVECASAEEAKTAFAAIEKIAGDTAAVDGLRAKLSKIAPRAHEIAAQLDAAITSPALPKDCPFC